VSSPNLLEHTAVAPDPSSVFDAASVLAFLERRETVKKATKPRKKATPPRGSGSPRAARAPISLPPPHIQVPVRYQDAHSVLEEVKAARRLKGFRDAAGLPWWAFELAERCHQGHYADELARLALKHRELAANISKAVDWQRSEHARRSVAALGLVLAWTGVRNPARPGRSTNIGGLGKELLRCITRTDEGTPYSHSAVAHRSHTTGATAPAESGEAGFLEALAQAGALKWWTPPAKSLPEWMLGAKGYAFSVYRVLLLPQGPPIADLGAPLPY
jgi:hypothetical protein